MTKPAAGVQLTTPPPTCAICMEPWTCNGGHRICCIPCGHVYGRSCLETWLHKSGADLAKCPQCSDQFRRHDIINLFAPGNLWDGCCRIQELKERTESFIKHIEADSLADFEKRMADFKEHCEILKDKMTAQMKAFTDDMMAEMKALTDGIERRWNEKMSILNASLTSMKEQMEKMAQEENTTAADVVEFMERISFPELSQISYQPFPSPPTVDSENAHQGHLNYLLLKPMPAPPGRADDVKRKRHQGTS